MLVRDFFSQFHDEEACLQRVMQERFGGTKLTCPSCGVLAQFHKLKERRVYACPECLFQIAPTAGTVLHDTRTPLVSWFYAAWLRSAHRNASIKDLQRQLGVTYKAAHRIARATGWKTRKAGKRRRARLREAQFRKLGHSRGYASVYGWQVPFEQAPEIRAKAQNIVRVAGHNAMQATMRLAAKRGWTEDAKPSKGVSRAYFVISTLLPHTVRG